MTQSRLEPRGNYLFVQPPDTVDVTAIKLLAFKIDEVCKQLEITKVLVEVRNRTSPSHNSEQLLQIGMFAADLLHSSIQIAVMVSYRKPEVHDFFEAIAETKGALIKFFEEESLAMEWLEAVI